MYNSYGEKMKSFYKLIQGDCLRILPTLESNSVDLVVTDPPYNLNHRDMQHLRIKKGKIKKTRLLFDGKVLNISKLIKQIAIVLKDGGAFYIFCGVHQIGEYIRYIKKERLIFSNFLVWYHPDGVPSLRKRAYQSHCQLIVFGHKEIENKYTFNYSKPKEMKNLLKYSGCTSFEYKGGIVGEYVGHPTQKPTKLLKKLISDSSNEGNIVLDPFLGSGATMSACQDLKRNCIGIEIDPKYCGIIKNRCFGRQFLDQDVTYEFDGITINNV